MKKLNLLLVALVVSATIFSCNRQEEVIQAIYAPNGDLVASSEEDLRQTMVEALDEENIIINKISFVDVAEGYIAEIDVATPDLSTKKVFHLSPSLAEKLVYDSDIKVVEHNGISPGARGPQIGGASVTCSCSVSSTSSQGCVASLEVGSNEVTATCTDYDCTSSCRMSVSVTIVNP